VRIDEGEDGVAVAVVAQGLHPLRVAGRRALVPQLGARAAPEPGLARSDGVLERLAVHVGERQHLTRAPVLHHARHEALAVEADLVGIYHRSESMEARFMKGSRAPW